MSMQIHVTKTGDHVNAKIIGRVDTNTASEVEKQLIPALEGAKDLSIDCEDLVYISSAGLRVVIKALKAVNDVELVKASEEVKTIFTVTGIADMLRFVD